MDAARSGDPGPGAPGGPARGNRRAVVAIWLGVAVAVGAILVPLAGPLGVAWHCYQLHRSGEPEQAEVLHKLEGAVLALRVVEGSHAGESCTADTSAAIYRSLSVGDRVSLVVVPQRPGDCELVSTIEASGRLLWLLSALVALLVGGIVGLGAFLHRTFTRPGYPARRLAADPGAVRCPCCGGAMEEGYVPLLAGLHWRRPGEPVGLPHALRGLPGTVGLRGRPRLHALRCARCLVLTLQLGVPESRSIRKRGKRTPGPEPASGPLPIR